MIENGMDIRRLYELFCGSKGVITDSRKVVGGELFFALQGENFDGNIYAARALEAGAAAAVVDNPQVAEDERYIVVPNVLDALQSLARHHRRQLSATVLAITGTNGKTTTKELVATVLSSRFRTYYTQGNLNNHIGVPLTLLSVPCDAEFLVVEMGASAVGEIALLASIAEPDYGLITNIGRAHLEGFGGEQGVCRGKGELYDALSQRGGVAIYRKDDAKLARMVAERADLRAVGYGSTLAEGVESNLVGDYNRFNVAAALAVGELFGVSRQQAEAAIGGYVPSNNRSQSLRTKRNLLTVDCYNANPSSMAVAVMNHAGAKCEGCSSRVMILGDMLELGEWSRQEHTLLLERALSSGVDRVMTVGRNFMDVAAGYAEEGSLECYVDVEELRERLQKSPLEGAFVLVKGSRGVGLERVIDLL